MSKGVCPPSRLVRLQDFEKQAKKNISEKILSYFEGGADEELTLQDNIDAFKRLRLRPTMLRGISEVNMSTTLLGQTVSMPICVAPTAYQRMVHPDGELATARASAKIGTCMTLSMSATTSMEDVAQSSPEGLRWLQFYYLLDHEHNKRLIRRAEKADFNALVFTVDSPVYSGCMDIKMPPHITTPHFEGAQNIQEFPAGNPITWKDIKWVKTFTNLPVVLKGILTAEDAKLAVQHGADAILVSNHGGRTLDGALATIDALPEVVSAVNGQIEVYMDGGVRLGTDVLKALALGARAVFIGRPVIWGLAYQGEEGVLKVLEILREEFRTAMILSGCFCLQDIKSSLIHKPNQVKSQL